MTAGEVSMFFGLKLQAIRGTATPQCAAAGLESETLVPASSACTAVLGVGGTRTVRRAEAANAVRITGVQALHSSNIPGVLLDTPGLPSGLGGNAGLAEGFIVRFTNGHLTGDTGVFGDMEHVIAKLYRPTLVVINIGPGNNGPNSIGPEDATSIIQTLVRPRTVIPSHVGEEASSGGRRGPIHGPNRSCDRLGHLQTSCCRSAT
jgi:L-ascorbate metabolism protein UlaG (beta-lactamase superfamily)